MNRRKMIKFIVAIFAIIYVGLIVSYKKTDTKITVNINKETIKNNLIGINSENNISINLIHRLRFSTSLKTTSQMLSISDSGECIPLFEIENGSINNCWVDDTRVYIIYQEGKDFYSNLMKNMSLYIYDLKDDKMLENEELNKRIWGIDYIGNKPIYDKNDIVINNSLSSNIYCDKKTRIYMDGRTLVEYNKEDGRKRNVLSLDKESYLPNSRSEIRRINNSGEYCLLISDGKKKVKIIYLDDNYKITNEKDFNMNSDLTLSVIGDDFIILLDDYDNITRISKDLDIEPSFSLDLENNEIILNVFYNSNKNVFKIVTNNKIILMDNEFKDIISTNKFNNEISSFY